MAGKAAVFLDRDGTLNVDTGYVHAADAFEWIPGAIGAIRRLNEAGHLVLVVTNQAGVARGYYTEDDVHRLHRHVQRELEAAGARIDAFYHAPYHVEGVVPRYTREHPDRKPGTGMFDRALREWEIDPHASFMIGDKASDLHPAQSLGMTTFLVETGYGTSERESARADFVVADVSAAVDHIVGGGLAVSGGRGRA
jgi:D-glycero-D-manno-heptose 1,7-bisphosphate phosphatase